MLTTSATLRIPALLLALIAAGCGQSTGNPGGIAVKGTVSIGGTPLTKGIVTFVPAKPGEGNTAAGEIQSDGSFTLGTAAKGDGVQPGNYKVAIVSVESEASMDAAGKPIPAKSAIPKKYGNTATSGLTATIEIGQSKPVQFDLTP
ncbi:hypothetical protein Spb1_34210 [Planctopirus ephydatiae]|uniref:Carboxypeptidase regulatory-like domain-containing protein n=1 Tax=Planctopirus ephydatiae TaxID=2528019 RepID=A0A518GSA7_9PLAN|nr:hypothetical protein [Planctopirus ephydatiae]QDV31476.1 hypothetical protein Spb1_34210 [Planctopirus ephydatiae]